MRAVVQRVSQASVRVDQKEIANIEKGLLVLLGVEPDDTQADLQYMTSKIAQMRIFEDEEEKMNLSVVDVEGEILLVSQFTLYGDVRKGRRPSFSKAAAPDLAERLYLELAKMLREEGLPVQTGQFAADMKVTLCNDGPVTILLDSKKLF